MQITAIKDVIMEEVGNSKYPIPHEAPHFQMDTQARLHEMTDPSITKYNRCPLELKQALETRTGRVGVFL